MKEVKIISDAIVGDGKMVFVQGKAYEIKPPTISKIARVMKYLSQERTGKTLVDCLFEFDKISEARRKGIAEILGKEVDGTSEEYRQVLKVWVSLISADDFFQFASLTRSVGQMMASPQ